MKNKWIKICAVVGLLASVFLSSIGGMVVLAKVYYKQGWRQTNKAYDQSYRFSEQMVSDVMSLMGSFDDGYSMLIPDLFEKDQTVIDLSDLQKGLSIRFKSADLLASLKDLDEKYLTLNVQDYLSPKDYQDLKEILDEEGHPLISKSWDVDQVYRDKDHLLVDVLVPMISSKTIDQQSILDFAREHKINPILLLETILTTITQTRTYEQALSAIYRYNDISRNYALDLLPDNSQEGKDYFIVRNAKRLGTERKSSDLPSGQYIHLKRSPGESSIHLDASVSLTSQQKNRLISNFEFYRLDEVFMNVRMEEMSDSVYVWDKEIFDFVNSHSHWVYGLYAAIFGLCCFIYLTIKTDPAKTNWFDACYTEIHLLFMLLLPYFGVLVLAFINGFIGIFDDPFMRLDQIIYSALSVALGVTMLVAVWLFPYFSLVKKVKNRRFWSDFFIVKIIKGLWSGLSMMVTSLRYRTKTTLVLIALLFFSFLLGTGSGVISLISLFILAYLVIWWLRHNDQVQKINQGVLKMKEGDSSYQIDSQGFFHDNKVLADNINGIAEGLTEALEKNVQAERMKTELITNVSHDLKTPLTSIISYIQLMKDSFSNPDAQKEYLEVLSEKADQLKKLTEDVVEASRVASGQLTLNCEQLNFQELLFQVEADHADALDQAQLELVHQLLSESVFVLADSRYLYRVLDNIYSNVEKYSQEKTRVYVSLGREDNQLVFELKNVSKDPLNISSQELMERFVRGDVARNSSGSGLGLSIARELSNLMDVDFDIQIDGDLFKVRLLMKEADRMTQEDHVE